MLGFEVQALGPAWKASGSGFRVQGWCLVVSAA